MSCKNNSEKVSEQDLTSHSHSTLGHFRDETFQTIDCTGTDNQKQGNGTIHTLQTQKKNSKTALANKQTKLWFGMSAESFHNNV